MLADKVGTGWSDAEQDMLVTFLQGFSAELMQQAVGCLQNFITIHTYDITGVDDAVRSLPALPYMCLGHSAGRS